MKQKAFFTVFEGLSFSDKINLIKIADRSFKDIRIFTFTVSRIPFDLNLSNMFERNSADDNSLDEQLSDIIIYISKRNTTF